MLNELIQTLGTTKKLHFSKTYLQDSSKLAISVLGLVNFSFKTDLRIILTLERNMNKLVESNKKVTAIPDNPDALIQFYDRP